MSKRRVSLEELTSILASQNKTMNTAVAEQIKKLTEVAPEKKQTVELNERVIDLTEAIKANTKTLSLKGARPVGMVDPKANDLSEKEMDQIKSEDHQTKILERIEQNTRGGGKGDKTDFSGIWKNFLKLGTVARGLALVLGGLVGYIMSQIGVLKIFARLTKLDQLPMIIEGWVDVLKNRFPKVFSKISKALEAVKGTVLSTIDKISYLFAGLKNEFPKMIGEFTNTITNFFKTLTGKFPKTAEFALKIFRSFMSGLDLFIEPFRVMAKMFKGGGELAGVTQKVASLVLQFFAKAKTIFSSISKFINIFGKSFGLISKVVSKLALPLTILMGVFDGVSKAIDGFKKEGLLGGIEGFIVGIVNSIFMSLFDLIKDGVSWILSLLGFDKAAAFLDSFSFEKLFEDLVHAILHPIEVVKDLFDKFVEWAKDLKLGPIEFEVFGKKFSFGPWSLMGDDKGEAKGSGGGAEKKPAPKLPHGGKLTTEDPEFYRRGGQAHPVKSPQDIINESAFPDMQFPDPKNRKKITKEDLKKNPIFEKMPKPTLPANMVSPDVTTGNEVYQKTVAEIDAAKKPIAAPAAPAMVNAPTTVNNTQHISMKMPIRNQESAYMNYSYSRMVSITTSTDT